MKIEWEVEDGYCGKSRPQFTEIDDEELTNCESDQQRKKLINDYIQEDFNQKISWSIIE